MASDATILADLNSIAANAATFTTSIATALADLANSPGSTDSTARRAAFLEIKSILQTQVPSAGQLITPGLARAISLMSTIPAS